jgi:cell division protein FtsW
MAQRLKTDWTLFLTVVVMVGFGLVVLYSASSAIGELRFRSSWHFVIRQLAWAVLAFLALMYFKRQDYRKYCNPSYALAGLGIVVALLVAVYFVDGKTHRWFRLGRFGSLQPSEFAKPALAVFLAWFVAMRRRAINDRHTILPAALAVSTLSFMVVIADLGTALVLVLTAVIVFVVGGLQPRYFALLMVFGLLGGGLAIASKGYRVARMIAFVDPKYEWIQTFDKEGKIKAWVERETAARDPGYQARQSKIAIGSGGVFGLGLMQGKQKLLYLPEAHSDFIYAVVGEELGLWGCTAVLAGFLVILWRGYRLCFRAPDEFGRYLALGLTSVVVVQALINMTVVLDLGPTKGIPLPMISAGGSSLLSTLTSLGMLLSISEHAG